MKKRTTPKPTEAELAILKVLWERGPSTVRQVHTVLESNRELAYTTTLKLIQIMTEKGLVTREEQDRTHVYQAAQGAEVMQQRLVGDLVDRAFGGSAAKLIMHALAARPATAEELREIRRLITTREEQEKNRGDVDKR
jgi:predicted transcriptional regulator